MAEYLIKDDGSVFPATEILAKRKDMRPFSGSLKDALKEAGRPVEDKFPEPKVLSSKKKEPEPPKKLEPLSRIEQIKVAISQLDPDSNEHYTKGGQPRVQAIEAILEDDITMDERNQAMEELEAK